jgi:hypothetical protein
MWLPGDIYVKFEAGESLLDFEIKLNWRFYKINLEVANHSHKRFQVLMAASMKFRVFWYVAPWSHVEVDRRFSGAYCVHHQGDDGGSMHLWNIGQDYMVLHPRRL